MMIIPSLLPDAPVADGILNTVGHTPLVRFGRFLNEPSVELFAKLEAMNPGGSAKDRPALQMLNHAIAAGEIDESTTIVESSSGNMGIGLAQACRYYGLQLICFVDPHAQPQNIAIMRALGAQIEQVCEPFGGSYLSARLMRVRQLLHSTPASFWPNQYANLQNPQAHFEGTIREIDEALNGDFDFLFVATSSTGTARGCRDYLRGKGRNVKVVAVDAEGSVLFGGKLGERLIPGLGAGRKPRLAKDQTFDEVRRVSDFDCVVGCRRAADREAVLVGGSAGGVLEVVRSMQSELMGRRCVAILHDSGARYMDTVYNDDWVQSKLGVPPEQLAARVSMHGDMLQAM